VHVLVEKPMAMNAAEAEAMVAASERSGACLMVGHVWRFDPEVVWLREQAAAGRLGQIVRTKGTCVHVHDGPGGWFTQKSLAGGGAMADMGIHAVDTARFLLGDPQPLSVYARIGTHYGDLDVDDTGVLVVNWNGGTTSYIEAGWWQPHADGPQAATQLYGTTGFGRVFPSYLEVSTDEGGAVKRIASDLLPVDQRDRRDKFMPQMSHFLDCIREGRQPNPGGEEGLVNMRVLDAAYESARTGQVVPVGARA
jgi:predicted dehydrogenase